MEFDTEAKSDIGGHTFEQRIDDWDILYLKLLATNNNGNSIDTNDDVDEASEIMDIE